MCSDMRMNMRIRICMDIYTDLSLGTVESPRQRPVKKTGEYRHACSHALSMPSAMPMRVSAAIELNSSKAKAEAPGDVFRHAHRQAHGHACRHAHRPLSGICRGTVGEPSAEAGRSEYRPRMHPRNSHAVGDADARNVSVPLARRSS